jgi:glyoxylase-like metal-dependent hydrolase (beta-lactamase superfamily II)
MEGNTAMIEAATKSMVDDKPITYNFVKDGDKIDLGGIEIEVIGFPGHTPGSVAYVERQHKVAFTGDSMLFRVLLSNREKLAQWTESVKNFAAKTKDIDTIVNGHQWEPFHQSDIAEELALSDAIMQRKITGSTKVILNSPRMIYTLGSKRIGLSDDK